MIKCLMKMHWEITCLFSLFRPMRRSLKACSVYSRAIISFMRTGKMTIKRYFEPNFTGDTTKSFEEVVDDIEKVMKESVEMHKISDVEVASYLSSGVDSSYLTYLGQVDRTFYRWIRRKENTARFRMRKSLRQASI